MPKSRSLRSLLEATQKKSGSRNPNAIITADSESELSPQSIPDPKAIAQDAEKIIDAVVGDEGATKKFLEGSETGKFVSNLLLDKKR